MANFWEDIVGSVTSGVKDLFSDKETYRELLSLLKEDPKLGKKQLARMQRMMNPNVMSVMGSQFTDVDPETGQATVRRVIPEGSLNMLNSRMQRWAEGPNFWDQPQAMYDHGDQLFKYRQAAQGMPETGAEWWRPPEPRTFEFVPFQNPGGAPHTGGSGAGGGVPGGGDLGEQLGPGVGDPADRIPQGNQEWMDRYLEGSAMDRHEAIFEQAGLGDQYRSLRDYYSGPGSTGQTDWGDLIEGFMSLGDPLTAILGKVADAVYDRYRPTEDPDDPSTWSPVEPGGERFPSPLDSGDYVAYMPIEDTPFNFGEYRPGDLGEAIDEVTPGFHDDPLPRSPISAPTRFRGFVGSRPGSRIVSYYDSAGRRITKREWEELPTQGS